MKKIRKERKESLLFTIPSIIMVVLVIYIPFALSGYYSLTEWNGISKDPVFVGLDNFKAIFTKGGDFLDSLIFTGKYTVLFVILVNIIALTLALILSKKFKLANTLRGVFFLPYIMSMTIVGFIWKFIFSQGFDQLYEITQWNVFKLSWLGEPKLAFFSVVIVGVWQALGFYIVIYIAGLQSLPADVLEAARVDGCTGWQSIWKITIPLLWPSIVTSIFMSLTNSLKVFDIILALTKGGPGESTYSATLNIYREAFQNNNYGLGSAKSLVFFVIVLIITQVVLKIFNSKEID